MKLKMTPTMRDAIKVLDAWERLTELGAWEYVPEFARELFEQTATKTTRILDVTLGRKGKRKAEGSGK